MLQMQTLVHLCLQGITYKLARSSLSYLYVHIPDPTAQNSTSKVSRIKFRRLSSNAIYPIIYYCPFVSFPILIPSVKTSMYDASLNIHQNIKRAY